ncbi:hypothetical protein MPLA_750122 [Mesorhizobium sp. ORS 3359]|nr:hypothetical protein MPLA_750122 [Mesorhizobium sp. ORS 3359]
MHHGWLFGLEQSDTSVSLHSSNPWPPQHFRLLVYASDVDRMGT